MCAASICKAETLVVPSGLDNVDGNAASGPGPAVNKPQTIRYQQVYASSEFGLLANAGGGWVEYLLFRGDTAGGTLGVYMPSVQVNLSTTRRGPDELSAMFSDNVGTDDTIIFSGRLNTVLIGGHGNSASGPGPAVNKPMTIRYQQVYAASEFGLLANAGGGWIVDLLFRGDTAGTTLGVYMPSVRVNLSTTKRGPDELSARFSDNVGTDDTVIFSGQLNTGLCGGHGSEYEPFEFEIYAYSKLFFYNPAAGNLLFDVRVFQGNTNTLGMIPIVFDAVNVTNDSVSRVWAADVNAITGSVDTIGLPTLIFFWANPTLTVVNQTDAMAVAWPIPAYLPAPLQTVLESSERLASEAQWRAITNGIVTSNYVNTFTVPLDSAGAAAYFRLVSTTPP